jgi:hypothetical protein
MLFQAVGVCSSFFKFYKLLYPYFFQAYLITYETTIANKDHATVNEVRMTSEYEIMLK